MGNPNGRYKHGHALVGDNSPEYRSWLAMLSRCTNPNRKAFDRYGGRGITVCEEWKDFETFLRDMGPRPEGTCLDRIDPNGNYTPENCRWVSMKVQRVNQARVKLYEYKGEMLSMSQLAEKYDINFWLLRCRLQKLGWDVTKAIETPSIPGQKTKIKTVFNG